METIGGLNPEPLELKSAKLSSNTFSGEETDHAGSPLIYATINDPVPITTSEYAKWGSGYNVTTGAPRNESSGWTATEDWAVLIPFEADNYDSHPQTGNWPGILVSEDGLGYVALIHFRPDGRLNYNDRTSGDALLGAHPVPANQEHTLLVRHKGTNLVLETWTATAGWTEQINASREQATKYEGDSKLSFGTGPGRLFQGKLYETRLWNGSIPTLQTLRRIGAPPTTTLVRRL